MAGSSAGKPAGMGPKYVEVTIDKDTGATEIEAHGFNGQGCRTATAALEKVLGTPKGRKSKDKKKQKVHLGKG